jgi:hypothetical protein
VVLGNDVKTIVLVLTVATILSGRAAADSIGTTYDMDKMLSEPHPMANEYGTRWQQPSPSLRPPTPGAPGTQPETLYRPLTPPPTAALPPGSPLPVPGQAPEPAPTTFAPPEPPPVSSTAPPAPVPEPASAKPPVAATAPPPPMMTPQLSIDLSGIDLTPEPAAPKQVDAPEPEAVLPPKMEKEMDQPGPRPPLPPG